MKIIRFATKIIGLLIIAGGVNSSFAEQIKVSTTFTCSTNAECRRKCEALGSDHTWKPNPGGATLGTCTQNGSVGFSDFLIFAVAFGTNDIQCDLDGDGSVGFSDFLLFAIAFGK
jgi:hypothetical protein